MEQDPPPVTSPGKAATDGARGSESERKDVPVGEGEARGLSDRLLTVIGGGLFGLALVAALVGGESDTGARRYAPALTLVRPAAGAVLDDSTLVVEFVSEKPLRIAPSGWGTDSLHLHLALDQREIMPAPRDIRTIGERRYVWVLARPDAGSHTIRLFWSGPDHRRIADGASGAATFSVP